MTTPVLAPPVIPADDILRACVHCGFCLPVCPTYRLLGSEPDSPRGRLYLMRAISEHTIPLTDNVGEHLYRCLDCRACETACPAGVNFGALLERGRAVLREHRPPSWWERALRRVFLGGVFPYPGRLHALMRLTRAYQRTGVQRLVRATRLLRFLPGAWEQREAQLPLVPARAFRAGANTIYHPDGEPRAWVALFTGCVQDELHGHVHAATVRVLLRYGCEVHVPTAQRCCGALHVHHGETKLARAQALANVTAFESDGFDAILNNAAGCGAALKEMGEWFESGDPRRARVERLTSLVRDVFEFLDTLDPPDDWRPIRRRVAYDDPCHLLHAQGIHAEPRALLRHIPELDLVDVPEADQCCGAAGIYSLTQPALAARIGAEKIARVVEVAPDIVATGNPGCMLQIAAGLRGAGRDIPVVHPIELLDEALGGPTAGTGSATV